MCFHLLITVLHSFDLPSYISGKEEKIHTKADVFRGWESFETCSVWGEITYLGEGLPGRTTEYDETIQEN